MRLLIDGELDHASRGSLRDAVVAALREAPTRIVLDLTDLTFCDASGVGLLVELESTTRARDCVLVLQNPHRSVRRVFEIVRLNEVIAIDTATGFAGDL